MLVRSGMGTIAENLKRLRQAVGMSQVKLALAANVSQQLISQIEQGKNTTTKELPALAKALGCPVNAIDENYEAVEPGARIVKMTTDEAVEMALSYKFLGGTPSATDEELLQLVAKASPEERLGLLQFLRARRSGDSKP